MKLDYQEVKTFKVCGIHFELASSWNGLEEWRDKDGRVLIVVRVTDPDKLFTKAFGAMFSGVATGANDAQSIQVISGTSCLLGDLMQAKAKLSGSGKE